MLQRQVVREHAGSGRVGASLCRKRLPSSFFAAVQEAGAGTIETAA
jgi:hypothetical protein